MIFLQTLLYNNQSNPGSGASVTSFLFLLLLVAVVLAVLFFLTRKIFKKENHLDVYLLTVPRYERGSKESSRSERPMKEQIALLENLFSALGSLKAERGFKAFWLGRADHISLEIIARHGEIAFYAALPKSMKEFFVQQITTVHHNVHVEKVPDYNIFQPQGIITGVHLLFKRDYIFPLKTYKEFEFDPLETIANALSKLDEGEGVAVQYIIRSAKASWHRGGVKVAASISSGKSLNESLKIRGNNGWSHVEKAAIDLFSSLKTTKKDDGTPIKPNREASQMDMNIAKALEAKTNKAGLDVNIRIISSSPSKVKAEANLRNLINAFGQFNFYEIGNSFKPTHISSRDRLIKDFIYRCYRNRARLVLNSEELVGLWHLPGETIDTPNIRWLEARKASPPRDLPSQGNILGDSDYRGQTAPVRIKEADRRRHVYVIGQTGVGKSVLMSNMIIQDIKAGRGVCVIDPHGDLVESVLANVPPERAEDVIIFDPSDVARPIGLNMLEFYTIDQKTFVINEMIKIFDKLYDLQKTGGPMFEQYMRNTMLLMMEDVESGSTLLEVSKVLSDEDFRKYKLSKTKNAVVRDFWLKEAQKAGGEAALANMVPYITSKLTQFISNDIMRPIIAQQTSSFNFRKVMDEKKILYVNLSKGKIGEMNSNLLGMVIVGKLLMAALSRVDIPEAERQDFYLYIDEFQNFITDSIAVILSEARKYKLSLTIAHQYIAQLTKDGDTKVRDAVFGNVGTKVAFRIGVEDAEYISKEFAPVFSDYDLLNIPRYNAYIKLLIDNQNPPAFNIKTRKPEDGDPKIAAKIKELSRLKYGRPREEIEAEILKRTQIQPPVVETVADMVKSPFLKPKI